MAQYKWEDMRNTLVEILRDLKHYKSGQNDEACYLTAYQLAVLLLKNHRQLLRNSDAPQNIGGAGEGEHTSLAQYVANSLSRDIKSGVLEDEVDLRFFSTEGLNQFTFLDEKGIISQPSSEQFSMFRYIGS